MLSTGTPEVRTDGASRGARYRHGCGLGCGWAVRGNIARYTLRVRLGVQARSRGAVQVRVGVRFGCCPWYVYRGRRCE